MKNSPRKFYRHNPSSKEGQNIVEYLLLTTAVILGLVYFLGPSGTFRGHMFSTLDSTFCQVDRIAQNVDFGNGAIP